MKRKILFTITLRCNNNCLNCFIPEEERKKGIEFSPEEIRQILRELKIGEGDVIEVSGGEPTIHRKIIQVLATFGDFEPKKIVLITNAENCADYLFSEKIAQFIDVVITNIYSDDRVVHDYLSQMSGSFTKKIEGLQNLQSQGVSISLKVIPMKPNYRRIPQLIEFVRTHFGRPHLLVKTLDIVGTAKKNSRELLVPFSDVVPYLEKGIERAVEYGIGVDLFFPLCLVDKSFWRLAPENHNKLLENTIFVSPNRGVRKGSKPSQPPSAKCRKCRVVNRCHWFRERYFELFGDGELTPIENKL